MKFDLKKLLPHLLAVGIFLVVALLYCKPALEGKAIEQHDLIQWKGMAKDGFNYKEKHGDFPEWTNSMFGGMPAYNIAFESNAYIPAYAVKVFGLWLPEPFLYFFLACMTFYFLSQVLRIKPVIGIIAALGFAYCSYDPIVIVTGHHTKMMTIAVMPALLASILLVFEHRKYWLGGGLVALFTSTVVVYNHLQMVFYMMIVIFMLVVAYAITWLKSGQWKRLVSAGAVSMIAAVIGALACAVNLFTTFDYSKESMRGGKASLLPDTAQTKKGNTSGLDVDYAFRWSYGIPETFSLLVPNVNGGGSQALGEDSKFYSTIMEKIQGREIDQNVAQQVAQVAGSQYWGDQPFTSGPVYLGAIICFLFILGMVNVPSFHKWWILAACALGIVMSWGSNFMGFNEFLFNHLPMYNKFRAPSQSLVIPQLLFPVIGMMGLQQLIYGTADNAEKWKQLRLAGIIAGGVLLVAALYYFSAGYTSANESKMLKQISESNQQLSKPIREVINAAGEDRKALFGSDLFRTIALTGIAFLLLWGFLKQKLNPLIPIIGLLVLSSFDLLAVGKRYLSDDNFKEQEDTEADAYLSISNPPLYKALLSIQQQDKDPHFRVFNTTSDPFNDALTSAMVRSVGGYHPAKLSIYNDLIENQLGKQNMRVYDMLDTKYFIVQGQQGPEVQQNPNAMGAAWFVKHVHYVPNAAAEMKSLDSLNLRDTAIVQDTFKAQIAAAPQFDSAASIKLTKYDNDILEYAISTKTPQFAVLSEIYYSRGWNAYADGKPVPIVKTDYVLRGVSIPANTQKLELKFEPESYKTGRMVTTVAGFAILLAVAIGLFMDVRKKKPVKTA